MRQGVANPNSSNYYNVEVFLNNLKQVLINNSTEKALAVVLVDSAGNQLSPSAIADDSASPGNPIIIGGQAKETDGTDPGSVSAEDDAARCITDRNRRLFVNTAHPNLWSANENHATAQTNNVLKTSPGSGFCLYITDMIISNGPTAGSVKIVEDAGGTPVDRLGPYYLAANAGMSKKFLTPIRISANKDVGFTSVTVTNHTVTLSGYIAP